MRVASLGGEYNASTGGRCELIATAAPASTPTITSAITAAAPAARRSARTAVCHGSAVRARARARGALPGRPVVDRRDFVIYGLSLLRRKVLRSWERRPRATIERPAWEHVTPPSVYPMPGRFQHTAVTGVGLTAAAPRRWRRRCRSRRLGPAP